MKKFKRLHFCTAEQKPESTSLLVQCMIWSLSFFWSPNRGSKVCGYFFLLLLTTASLGYNWDFRDKSHTRIHPMKITKLVLSIWLEGRIKNLNWRVHILNLLLKPISTRDSSIYHRQSKIDCTVFSLEIYLCIVKFSESQNRSL